MLKPEKCPKCDAVDGIVFIEDALEAIVYSKEKCKDWLCKWRCSNCHCNYTRDNYKSWWCGNCNSNFSSEEAGIHTMYINMKNGGCKHFELRDSDVQKAVRNRKK